MADFQWHRSTKGPCGPTRAEMDTGLFFPNHGINIAMTEPTVITSYRQCFQGAGFEPTSGEIATYDYVQGSDRIGPWDYDRAKLLSMLENA